MTVPEKNEIINAILTMWRKVTKKINEEEEFLNELQESTDVRLVSIFKHYKDLIKKENIEKEPGMYVSNSTYIAIMNCLNNIPKSAQAKRVQKNIKNPILNKLMTIKQKDFYPETSDLPEGEECFLDYQRLSKVSEERQEQVLALIMYFNLLKSANIYELTKSQYAKEQVARIAKKINEFFPYRTDFYRYTQNRFTEQWEQIPESERLPQLRILLKDVIQKPDVTKNLPRLKTID